MRPVKGKKSKTAQSLYFSALSSSHCCIDYATNNPRAKFANTLHCLPPTVETNGCYMVNWLSSGDYMNIYRYSLYRVSVQESAEPDN